ncbi:MAG: DUF3293 domain-containing protein [Leptospiraceae bacterium]|nr:DUF3293 domain-containing protein [Leptospiraceae bacterium]
MDLETAYLETKYLVYLDKKNFFSMEVGKHPPERFLRFLKRRSYNKFAYISPCNPCSVLLDKRENKKRVQEFIDLLRLERFAFLSGRTNCTNRKWNESSFCIFQISLDQARDIAFTFSQNAFLYWTENSQVQLHWTFENNLNPKKVEN